MTEKVIVWLAKGVLLFEVSVALKTEFSPSKSASDVFNLTSFTLSESVILSFALTALIEIKIIKALSI